MNQKQVRSLNVDTDLVLLSRTFGIWICSIGNNDITGDLRDYLLHFPVVMKAAVSLFSLKPFMSPEELKELVESRVGFPLAVPGNTKLSLDHIRKYYSQYFKKNGLLKEEIDALKLLLEAIKVSQAKQSPLDNATETNDREIQPNAKSSEIGKRSVPVVCNGNKGIFNLREQNVSCLCPACQSLAKKEGLEHIAISPSCFEQHSGMTTNKKWKYSIRIDGETFKTMGNFLEENNLEHEYKGNCRSSKYDAIVRGMDHERMMGVPVPPGPPQGRGQKDYDESGKQMDADAVENFSNVPQSGSAFQGASRRKPNASILSEMHSSAIDALPFVQRELQSNTNKFESEEEQHYNEAKGPDTSKDVNSRSLRKRKTPDWTEQSIDSEKRNKKSLASTFELNVDEEKVPSEGGKDHKSRSRNQEHYTIGSDELAKRLYNERQGGRANIYLSSMHASTIEENPEIIHWKFLNTNELSLVVKMGDIIFRGALPSLKNGSDSNNEHGRINIEEHLPANELQNAIHLNSVNESDSSGKRNRQNSTSNFGGRVREHISNIKKRKEMKIPVHAMPVREDAKIRKQDHKAGGTDASASRRDRALEEYQNLIESGPPPGTKCCLCHLTENETIPNSAKGLLGRAYAGLGRLQLVRTSAIQNSWVHEQCIRWSPDVYDPVGDGLLNNVKDEIRRGRMLRCRVCNEKGATLGCMKKTCKYSYHLHCARDYDCLLNIDPYAVACPEHVDQLPDGLGRRIGIKHKAKRRGSENPSDNNKSARKQEDRAHPNNEKDKNRDEKRKSISPLQNNSRIRSKENSASKNRSGEVEIPVAEDKTNRRFSLRSSARKGDESGIEEIHITD